MHEDPNRNPVIVIPGLLGSKLVDQDTGDRVWGAFGLGQVDPNTPTGARQFALPMETGKSLKELRDHVKPDARSNVPTGSSMPVPMTLSGSIRSTVVALPCPYPYTSNSATPLAGSSMALM